MLGWGSAASGHSRRSCPPATAVMMGMSPLLPMLGGAVGHGPVGQGVPCWLDTPISVPVNHAGSSLHSRPLFWSPHQSQKRTFHLSGSPRLGSSFSPPASPLLLHCWGHTTLDADMEAPAVLPCRASGQAGVQATISHLHSQEREKLRHKKKTQVGRKKAELLPQCSQCGACSHSLTRARALPAAVHPSPR